MTKTVYVVGGDRSVCRMFLDEGWEVHGDFHAGADYDLICFTGGSDIHPRLYGEEINGAVGIDEVRDDMEHRLYDTYVGKVPFVGICRGGQFLNVMNGGRLIQDHGLISGIVDAWAFYEQDGEKFEVHVDHHQGIIPAEGKGGGFIHGPSIPSGENIAYVYWYGDTKSLCFQPHPEWGHEGTKKLFFDLIEEYIG